MDMTKWKIDKDLYNKSKDVLPTLDLGQFPIGSEVEVTLLEEEPKEIEVKDINNPGKTVKTLVIPVQVLKADVYDKEDGFTEKVFNEKMSLWLSATSLRLALLRAIEVNDGKAKGLTVTITISEALFKQGKNRCYNIKQ